MAQNLKDLAGRLPAGPRGMGTALKLLLGAGAVAYGVRESVFTGEQSARPWPPRQPSASTCALWPDPCPSPPQWKADTEPSSLTASGACSRTPSWPRASTSGNSGQNGLDPDPPFGCDRTGRPRCPFSLLSPLSLGSQCRPKCGRPIPVAVHEERGVAPLSCREDAGRGRARTAWPEAARPGVKPQSPETSARPFPLQDPLVPVPYNL